MRLHRKEGNSHRRAFVLFKLHNLYDGSPKPSNSVIRYSTASESRHTYPLKLKNRKALTRIDQGWNRMLFDDTFDE